MTDNDPNAILECRGGSRTRAEWAEMLPAMANRFKEEVEREVPFLKEFVEERNYHDLPKLLALEDIKKIFWYFRVFHEASKNVLHKIKMPNNDIRKITKVLDNLHKQSWIGKQDKISIADKLTLSLLNSPLGNQFQLQRDKKLFKQKGGPIKDFAIDFLIYVLVENIKEKTGDPKYELICQTLYPQINLGLDGKNTCEWPDEEVDLLESLADYDAVYKRYQRIKGDFGGLLMNYNIICRRYLWPISTEYLPLLPDEFASQFSNLTTPDFIDFLPFVPTDITPL